MNKVIDKGFRSCRFVSTIVKHPVYILVFFRVLAFSFLFTAIHVKNLALCVWEWRRCTIQYNIAGQWSSVELVTYLPGHDVVPSWVFKKNTDCKSSTTLGNVPLDRAKHLVVDDRGPLLTCANLSPGNTSSSLQPSSTYFCCACERRPEK